MTELNDISPEENEMINLIQKIEHPQLPAEIFSKQRNAVSNQARAIKPRFPWTWRMAPAALGMVAVLTVLFLLFSPASSSHAATLTNVSGVVEIAPTSESQDWQIVQEGQELKVGMHLRTRMESTVLIQYRDGSQTIVQPESDLTLTQIAATRGSGLQVTLEQNAGSTLHNIIPFQPEQGSFIVITPAGQAVVHGTIFSVELNEQQARFAVERGKIQVSNPQGNVLLSAGQATISDPQTEPETPAYEFNLQGAITEITDTTWSVNGVTFNLGTVDLQGISYLVGDRVFVRGRILDDGAWSADKISLARSVKDKAHFTGLVQQIGENAWVVNNLTFSVNEETLIADQIAVGSPVEVSFIVQADGTWLATEITTDIQDEEENEDGLLPPGQDPNRIPPGQLKKTGTPQPTLQTTPEDDENEDENDGDEKGVCTHDKQQPDALKLAERYGVTYEEIMEWFCQGFGFGEIDLAYELSAASGQSVDAVFAMRADGTGWGQIKQQLTPKATKTPKAPKTKK